MRLSGLCQIECLHESGNRVPACVPAQRTQHCLATSLESKACKTTHRNKATMAFSTGVKTTAAGQTRGGADVYRMSP